MNFFKALIASTIGTLLAMVLIILIFVIMIVSSVSGSDEKVKKLTDNSILHIKLDEVITERSSEGEIKFQPGSFQSEANLGLNQFIEDLQDAAKDEKIKGIFLEPSSVMASPSTMLDVHKALEDFRASGKWIVAYSEDYSQGTYYLASTANEVYLYPEGSLDWRGINAEIMFFKKMLDKLEIEAQIIRGPNNKFKSAVEPFMYDHMSEANKVQVETFISDIWRIMLEGISQSRNISIESLNAYADSLMFVTPDKVAEYHMVDGLKYRDEVISILKSKVGMDATAKDDDMNLFSLNEYHSKKNEDDDDDDEPDYKKDKVAVVYAVGAIESGEGNDETIGSERIARALKEAREDEKVKAIVLRVNSPGGSALASDVIWRETKLIRDSGKTFYVSMGDYAASGGYYISCSAEKIYANPNTITGSIGVFGIVPNFQKFWDNKLGITFDRYETNPHADLISTNKPFDEKEMQAMQSMVTSIYDDFTSKVATGRNMTQANVDSIGQGRVWSGEDAKNIGLVDEIGNLDACVKAAAAKAGFTDYAVKDLPKMIDPFEEFMQQLTGQKQAKILQEILGDQYHSLANFKHLTEMRGIQARLPFFMEIK
ncbi:MAG: signal peptide peptidase SppA [Flavobacteriales bacterium]|nr:signal peptide peptidase SppA [Flavobacteriales bacterium]